MSGLEGFLYFSPLFRECAKSLCVEPLRIIIVFASFQFRHYEVKLMSGKLEAIWLKRGKGAPMDAHDHAQLIAGRGLLGNANQGGKRQVTILAQERWQELLQEVGANLSPKTRRANLVVSGIDLSNSRGRILLIGACRVLIHGETRPCEQMEAAWPGLQEAMRRNWSGGAFAEVLDGGEIRVGETIAWQDD